MQSQCGITWHAIKDHILLLLLPGHKVCQLPYYSSILSKHTCTDYLGPSQLAPGLKGSCDQGNFI